MKKTLIHFATILAFLPAGLMAQSEFSGRLTVNADVSSLYLTYPADIDGDGDLDVLSCSGNDVLAWYENTDGLGTFGPLTEISTEGDYVRDAKAADLDGDGDNDVLIASSNDDEISWFENTDGLGTFGPQQVISNSADLAWSVFAADIDGDGDLDAVSGSSVDDRIAWYENTDGEGAFGPPQDITTTADLCRQIFVADLDGDGDMDVMSSTQANSTIAWYENTDGAGTFSTAKVVWSSHAETFSSMAVDVDNDGDYDIVASSPSDDEIAWFENTDGAGTFSTQKMISDDVIDGARFVFAGDADNDGDADVFTASWNDFKIAWFENLDGGTTWSDEKVLELSTEKFNSVHLADFNGDGWPDVLAAEYYGDIVWYRNDMYSPPELTLTVTDATCPGATNGSINLDISGGVPPFTFLWNNGEETEDLSNLAADKYIVTVTDGMGFDHVDSILVGEPDPIPDTELFAEICAGESLFLEGAERSESGIYYDTISSLTSGCDSVLITELTVHEVNTMVDIPVGSEVSSLLALAEDATFQWMDCDDQTLVEDAIDPLFVPLESGNYAVIVTQHSCIDTSGCYQVTVTSVGHDPAVDFNVYPNPSNGSFYIEPGNASKSAEIRITDSSGRTVFSETVQDMHRLKAELTTGPGVYVLMVQSGEKYMIRKLVVK